MRLIIKGPKGFPTIFPMNQGMYASFQMDRVFFHTPESLGGEQSLKGIPHAIHLRK